MIIIMPQENRADMTDVFEFRVPVLVMGGGACGAAAALAARDAGADVLLIERDGHPMGTTGMSMGVFCAAGTKAQAKRGIEDDGDTFFADIMAKSRGEADPVVAHALAHGSGPTIDWLSERFDIDLDVDMGFRPSYGNSRLRIHGWLGHGGQDVIELLHQRMADAGVDVLMNARVVDIIAGPDGAACGVEIERPDGAREFVGCDTLVVASGGFAANHEMLAQYIPAMAEARNNGHESSQGDGIRLTQKLGGDVGNMGAFQGYAMLTDPQGISVSPAVLIEGGVIVNNLGQRFTDESEDIAGMVFPVMAQPDGYAWVIYDDNIDAKTGYIPDMQMLAELNTARLGADTAALAQRIGVDADALAATLAEAHEAHKNQRADAVGRVWGAESPPSGALRAMKVVGAIYHTQGGLQINGEARVLRADGSALPNIFAGGGAARSVSGSSSWGYLPAMGLCTALTLGRIAGQTAARQALGSSLSDNA
jgi:fumarate reductase flavoprotein subunit